MTEEKKPLLEVIDLVKSYPAEEGGFLSNLFGGAGQRIPALNGVSFTLEEGEVLGLTGESGCGKSALAKIISGYEKPDKGKVLFNGKNITAMSENELKTIRRNLRYVPEDAFTGLSSDPKNRVDNLLYDTIQRFPPQDGGAGGKAAANAMLSRVGLGEEYLERFPHQLSGGQRQRLAIARALMLRPRLIIADEPVSNLDLNTRTEMLNLMKRLGREYRTAFIFISHNPSMVRYFTGSGRFMIMFAGRIMESLTASELFDRSVHPYTKTLLEANPAPSPLPGAALDPALAFSEEERVDQHSLALDTLESEMSAEGSMALSAQLAAANRPGCPFYRWCPERFERCPDETPLLQTTVSFQKDGNYQPLPQNEIDSQHKAACLRYNGQ
jgi:ABC-type oligopeptide transport system ATPase subunit